MHQLLNKYRYDQSGGTIPLFTVALPLVLGALAVSVEAGYWYKTKADMQMVVDMAAYAGAIELSTGDDPAAKIAAVIDALNNGYDDTLGTITVNIPPTMGSNTSPTAVEVIMRQKGNQYFSTILGTNKINYRNRAVAEYFKGADACMLALNSTVSGAFTAMGSTNLSLNNCAIGVNSNHESAAIMGGSSSTSAECLSAVGGIDGEENGTFVCGSPISYGAKLVDPYEDISAPDLLDYPTCTSAVKSGKWDYTLSGGRYCSNLTIKGSAFLDSDSTYIFDGIDVKFISTTSTMVGSGVTIVLMNGATLSGINGGTSLILSAPTSGDYKGIAIYSDPVTQTPDEVVKLNGGSATSIEGLLYFPTQSVEFSGNTSGANACTVLVADTIQLTGSSELETTGCEDNFDLETPYINRGTYLVQ